MTEVPRDSPTLSAQAEALILQCVASNKWKFVSGNIKTAFFSRYEEHRNIFVLLPDDVRDTLKLSPELMLRLRKAVYGLAIAPKKWWGPLKRSLLNHGFTSCALDPCGFFLIKQNGVRDVTGVHLDSLLGRSDEVCDRVILEVKREFDFGASDAEP